MLQVSTTSSSRSPPQAPSQQLSITSSSSGRFSGSQRSITGGSNNRTSSSGLTSVHNVMYRSLPLPPMPAPPTPTSPTAPLTPTSVGPGSRRLSPGAG